jgi:hypothetical protein
MRRYNFYPKDFMKDSLINVGCYVLRGLAEDSKCDKQSIDDDDDDCNINFDLKDESLMLLMNVEGGSQMVTLKKKQFDTINSTNAKWYQRSMM